MRILPPFNDRELKAEVRNLLALKANERRVVELNTYLTESKQAFADHIGEQGSKARTVAGSAPGNALTYDFVY